MRALLTVLLLFGLWLSMSGIYKPMVIGFGFASSLVAVYVVHRMDRVTPEGRFDFSIRLLKLVLYFLWLLKEIAKANWAVTKIIMAPELKNQPNFFMVETSQSSDLAVVIFANSITLTPGTISVEVDNDSLWVHALNYSTADAYALADMDRRVTKIEG